MNFSNITAWPQSYPSYSLVSADGNYAKASFYNFESNSALDSLATGKYLYSCNHVFEQGD